jgi:hypothetical protein
MRNLEEEARKKRTNPVYLSTYRSSDIGPVYTAKTDWPSRDSIPVDSDPIGDVVTENLDVYIQGKKLNLPVEAAYELLGSQYSADLSAYNKMMKDNVINPEGKFFGNMPGACCENQDKYKNIVSKSLQFYSCRNCGADLGDA